MKNRIYTIQVLEDKDYEALHEVYPKLKEEDLKMSLGFADTEEGAAYVRKTNVSTIDEATMQHELQELLSKDSEHTDENCENIRWKGGSTLEKILTADPFGLQKSTGSFLEKTFLPEKTKEALTDTPVMGDLLSRGMLGSTVQQFTQEGKNYAESPKGQKQYEMTYQTIPALVGSAVAGGVLGSKLGAGAAGGSTGSSFGTGAGTVGASPVTLGGQSYGLVGGSSGLSAIPAATSAVSTVTPVSGLGAGSAGSGLLKTLGGATKNYLSKPDNLLGAGSLLGSTMIKEPEYQQPQSVEDIRSKLLSGGTLTEQGKLAQEQLGTILKSSPTDLYPTESDAYYQAALRRTETAYSDAMKQLDAAYNQAGVYGSGEHLAAKDKLNKQLTDAKADLYAQTESANKKLSITAQYQAIQQALGVDQNVMNDLLGLTGYDVQTAAAMYNAKVQDVNELRSALGTLGSELLIRGTSGTKAQTAGVLA